MSSPRRKPSYHALRRQSAVIVRARSGAALASVMLLVGLAGCGRPDPANRWRRPSEVTSFTTLFGKNCSGCHGMDGQLGPAPPLNDPLFQAIISDKQLTDVIASGREGTLMPEFARSHGGPLTDKQVGILVDGIRERWAKPLGKQPEEFPPYQLSPTDPAGLAEGNETAGAELFADTCATCHGKQGQGGAAGPIRGHALGVLMSDQLLRRLLVTGRPDFDMPDYDAMGRRSDMQRPLTSQDLMDLAVYVRKLQQVGANPVAKDD